AGPPRLPGQFGGHGAGAGRRAAPRRNRVLLPRAHARTDGALPRALPRAGSGGHRGLGLPRARRARGHARAAAGAVGSLGGVEASGGSLTTLGSSSFEGGFIA